MTEVEEFHYLMQRVRDGCPEATRDMIERFGPYVRREVRRRLARRLRNRFDSIDFLQDVWEAYFAVANHGPKFDHPKAFVAYLVTIARNKVIDTTRAQLNHAQNDTPRERSIESAVLGSEQLAARQATPSQEVVADETWDKLIAGLPRHHQLIVYLIRQGNTPEEAAERLGLAPRTVYRVLAKLTPGKTS